MRRTSTDRAYLEAGSIVLDADGIPVDVGTMQARLAALEYSSRRRNITSLLPGVVSGDLFALRIGHVVSLEFSTLKLTPQAGSFIDLGNVIPDGFRVSGDREFFDLPQPTSGSTEGPIRLRRVGALLIYGANNEELIYGTVTYQTLNPPPATPPGTPA